MTIRERLEGFEALLLSPFASHSASSKGRQTPLVSCPLRTEFQRDRDRILHCKTFRRLKHKTQVFLSPEGDHYRTRLTHTLEVSQIARTISRALMLNEDLTEAIALGHDLGHTPFGHIGERTLSRLTHCGFTHNAQSLRVVEKLENDGLGLNLTFEVRDGIAHHSGDIKPQTLEGQVVHLADRIAYINHDIDDALRANIITYDMLPRLCIKVLGATHGERINTMISDIISSSDGKDEIAYTDEIGYATDLLRDFLFENVYRGQWRLAEEAKADYIVSQLFQHFLEHPTQLPNEYLTYLYNEGYEVAVCDYIAGMTDRYAVKLFQSLFVPTPFV